MTSCSNCGYQIPPDKASCPNCDQSVETNSSWPPEPLNTFVPIPRNVGKLLTGSHWDDVWIGFILTWLLLVFYGIGAVVIPILYWSLRKRYPSFRDGLGYGLISAVIVLAGFLALTFSSAERF